MKSSAAFGSSRGGLHWFGLGQKQNGRLIPEQLKE